MDGPIVAIPSDIFGGSIEGPVGDHALRIEIVSVVPWRFSALTPCRIEKQKGGAEEKDQIGTDPDSG